MKEMGTGMLRRMKKGVILVLAVLGVLFCLIMLLPDDGEEDYVYEDNYTYEDETVYGQQETTAAADEKDTEEIPAPEEYKDDRIDLNSATIEQLCTLKGIGPAKAQAILDYRDAYGGFVCIEEIMEVKGIGESTFAKIKDYLYIPD